MLTMPHVEVLSGKIISSQVGFLGKDELPYGFITVENQEGKHVKLKIDAYTEYETIKINDHVRVHVHRLANTDVLVARDIVAATPFTTARSVEAETT
ncbi:MAG: hypothetical protein ACFFEA_09505 [Candidatus Thorarchaeota archaeon]